MISGAHVIVYGEPSFATFWVSNQSTPATVWLIFALPPAEAAFHPSAGNTAHELYFLCDDVHQEIRSLGEKGVPFSEVVETRWGSVTRIDLPGG